MNSRKEINVVISYKDSIGVTSVHFFYLLVKAKRLNINVNIIRPFVLFKGLFSILGFKNSIREIRDLQELEGEYIVSRPLYNILYGFYFGLYELRSKIVSKLMKKQIKYHDYGIKDIFNIENTSSFDPKTIEKIDWSSIFEHDFNLSLKNESKPINKEIMQKIGINDNDWYVCVHVRTGFFHGDPMDGIRNANISNYIKAIKYIQSLGGKVVRLGDRICLPHSEDYIDYPNSEYKSQYMDLYLIKHCRFYIGTSSGILDTAYLFHKPVLMVNVAEFITHTVRKIDRLIYKYVVNNKTGKMIPYKQVIEYLNSNVSSGVLEIDTINKMDCSIIENTEDDIFLAVQEFILNLEKDIQKKPSKIDKAIKQFRYLEATKNDKLAVRNKYEVYIRNFGNGGVCDFFEKKYFDF